MNSEGQVFGLGQFFDNAHDFHHVAIAYSTGALVVDLRNPFEDDQVETIQQDLVPQPPLGGSGVPFERGQRPQVFVQIETGEVFEPVLPPLLLFIRRLLQLLRLDFRKKLLF